MGDKHAQNPKVADPINDTIYLYEDIMFSLTEYIYRLVRLGVCLIPNSQRHVALHLLL